jgi:hypothetical protein
VCVCVCVCVWMCVCLFVCVCVCTYKPVLWRWRPQGSQRHQWHQGAPAALLWCALRTFFLPHDICVSVCNFVRMCTFVQVKQVNWVPCTYAYFCTSRASKLSTLPHDMPVTASTTPASGGGGPGPGNCRSAANVSSFLSESCTISSQNTQACAHTSSKLLYIYYIHTYIHYVCMYVCIMSVYIYMYIYICTYIPNIQVHVYLPY